MNPLFILSLPRSGSTLLQRILASHKDIATTSEPWLLLPLFYTLREEGVYSEYAHRSMVIAIEDFYNEMPGGREDYLLEIRKFAQSLYAKASNSDAKYFLDKTPRYALIVKEIMEAFPEAKFIFLWRNPLAVIASIMETWAEGQWNLHKYKVDLFSGLENLTRAFANKNNAVCSIRYEDLIDDPKKQGRRIFDYLELNFDPCILSQFGDITFTGRMGDPMAAQYNNTLSCEPLMKWKRTLQNPIRKVWCERYLKWIGKNRLAIMGYDLENLLSDLNKTPTTRRYLISDIFWMSVGRVWGSLDPAMQESLRGFRKRYFQKAKTHNEHNLK